MCGVARNFDRPIPVAALKRLNKMTDNHYFSQLKKWECLGQEAKQKRWSGRKERERGKDARIVLPFVKAAPLCLFSERHSLLTCGREGVGSTGPVLRDLLGRGVVVEILCGHSRLGGALPHHCASPPWACPKCHRYFVFVESGENCHLGVVPSCERCSKDQISGYAGALHEKKSRFCWTRALS